MLTHKISNMFVFSAIHSLLKTHISQHTSHHYGDATSEKATHRLSHLHHWNGKENMDKWYANTQISQQHFVFVVSCVSKTESLLSNVCAFLVSYPYVCDKFVSPRRTKEANFKFWRSATIELVLRERNRSPTCSRCLQRFSNVLGALVSNPVIA